MSNSPIPPEKPPVKGLRHLVKATGYSLQGLVFALREETAFRQELGLVILMTPLAFLIGNDLKESALLIATLLLVLIVELLNSAIEAAIDRIGPESHPLSGKAKDLGSAAVFIALILTGLIWSLTIYQNLLV